MPIKTNALYPAIKRLSMNNSNILAALAGALPRCQSLAGNDHAARLASCIASRQHSHNCPSYPWTDPKYMRLLSKNCKIPPPEMRRGKAANPSYPTN